MSGVKSEISHSLGSHRVISFPKGSPPDGSCEFMTEKCQQECANWGVNFPFEHTAFKMFKNLSADLLADMLRKEMSNSRLKVLSWFTESGDCLLKLLPKTIVVMKSISGSGIIQNGFTRNPDLWKQANEIKNVRFALTDEEYAPDRGIKHKETGIIAVPNYKEERIKLYVEDTVWLCGFAVGTCGMGRVLADNYTTEEDCGVCYSLKRGCFAKMVG